MQQKKRKIGPSSLKSLLAKRQEIYYLLILLKVKFFIFLKSQIHVVISSLMKLLNFFLKCRNYLVLRRCYRVLKFIFCSIYAIIMLSSLYSSLIKKISKVLWASIKITNDDTNYVLNLGSELASSLELELERTWKKVHLS